uniref:Lysine--tRNA ligase n=1 Tax=Lygus hesperus TaxID=30085 RepID=A0A0A9YWT0_LYGHE
MDPTHNPEFTSCEVYMANTTLEYMMELTEQLFRELVHIVHSTTCITVQDTCIDFSQPFHRIDVYEGLIQCGIHLPEDLHTPEALQSMLHICHEHGIQVRLMCVKNKKSRCQQYKQLHTSTPAGAKSHNEQ